MPRAKKRLETERILLRELKESDAKSIYKHAKNKEIIRYTDLPHPYRPRHAKEFIKNAVKDKENELFGIEIKETKELIGVIKIDKGYAEKHKEVKIGFWIGKEYHGKGIMTEVLFAMLDYIFRDLGMNRVYCDIFENNIGSLKLVRKLGFKHAGTARQGAIKFGRYLDTYEYGLIEEEWKKARRRLKRKVRKKAESLQKEKFK